MKWRLGLDLGTNSLGWAAIALHETTNETTGILAAGSRIFSSGANGAGRDAKSGESLAVARRDARSMRRRRDRFKQRQAALIKYLIRDGLFPEDQTERKALEALDPYELRARALNEPLTLPELGRALFHLNQRRGFQSNRKTDRKEGDEAGKVAVGIDNLEKKMEEIGARTLGEFLHLRRASADNANTIPSVRTRLRAETDEGAKGNAYEFYPGRHLLKNEFNEIWEEQAPHHPNILTDEVHDRLFEIIFHQRPLKPPKIGKCTLVDGEDRLPKAHPLFQRRRLLEEVNHLRIVRAGKVSEALLPDKRDIVLVTKTSAKAQITFDNIRKSLKLHPEDKFNKESDNRSFILGDEVAVQMGAKARFGSRWAALSVDEQWAIIERQQNLESDADDAAFRTWLIDTYDLTPEQAKATAGARLPTGIGRFGLTATKKLIHALTHEVDKDGTVLTYDKAVIAAGLGHHSDRRTDKTFEDEQGRPTLPYYGIALERHLMPGTGSRSDSDETRVGRLTNPTVHIALNQLRRVVRRLILAYGKPAEIVVELARDLNKSDDEKREENQRNATNRREAEKRSAKLVALGQTDNGANRALLKLWEELDQNDVLNRRCVYSGTIISCHMLFSGQVQVDHILPYALTLDDSNANKLLCTTLSNQEKGKKSPFDRWGHTEKWPEIAERASHLPKNKRWRFEPDAMTRFDEEGGFLDRHLKDTQYLSRLAREYLETLYPERGENSSKVWVSPGRLTEIVRRKLGLNELLGDHNIIGAAKSRKNRLDHRHHAIDAVVVAIIDRSFLRKAQTLAGIDGKDAPDRIRFDEPWPGFRDELRDAVRNIVVAHRPDHGTATKIGLAPGLDQTAGRLHNDTAYGLTGTTDLKGGTLVVHRVPLTSLKSAEDIGRVRDPVLRADLLQFTQGLTSKAFDARLLKFRDIGTLDYRGIERVRILRPLAVIPIRDATGRAYKAYKGDSNYRYDVWEMPDGKWVTHWTDREGVARSSIVSMFDAHQRTTPPRPHPAARRILSLQQDDVVAIEQDGGERRLMRVVKFRQTGQVTLAEHYQGGDLKRRDATSNDLDDFKYLGRTASALKALRTRQVRIDEIGRVMDPGFPARKSARMATTE